MLKVQEKKSKKNDCNSISPPPPPPSLDPFFKWRAIWSHWLLIGINHCSSNLMDELNTHRLVE